MLQLTWWNANSLILIFGLIHRDIIICLLISDFYFPQACHSLVETCVLQYFYAGDWHVKVVMHVEEARLKQT